MQLVTENPSMCLTPVRLKNGAQVACRSCAICRQNRLSDLVGRSLAEQAFSGETLSLTLTYAGDTTAAVVPRYSDVQNLFKRLRSAGFPVRYICAGEYGTKKGRLHWHIILFFKGKAPDYQLNTQRYMWSFWPHGFTFFQQPDYAGFRYVLKYALKQDGSEAAVKSITMSKKPPLAYEFFMELADRLVTARLPIHSPEYAFSHVEGKTGIRRFWLQGRMREIFFEAYIAKWRAAYKTDPPETEWFQEQYLDKVARSQMDADPSNLERGIARRKQEWIEKAKLRQKQLQKERTQTAFLLLVDKTPTVLIAFSDQTAEIVKEDETWLISASGAVAAQLLKSGVKPSNVKPCLTFLRKQWRLSLPSEKQ